MFGSSACACAEGAGIGQMESNEVASTKREPVSRVGIRGGLDGDVIVRG